MVIAMYLFWFFVLVGYVYFSFRKQYKKLNTAIDALRKIASTDYDMNKLVCIAIKALKDIDNIK